MKKIKYIALVLIFLFAASPLLTSCDATDKDKLQVYASIYPLYFLAESIGGEKAQVYSVLPWGGSAHGYEPSLRQSGRMRQADILILIGAGMEEWGENFIASLEKGSYSYFDKEGNNLTEGLLIVDTSRDINLILGGEAHEEEEDKEEHHGLYDAHTWTSIKNMREMAQSIYTAFVLKDAQNESYYNENFQAVDAALLELEQEYQSALSPYSGKSIVVSHKAFTYLCADYGLNQIPVQISSEQTAGLAQIAQIVEIVMEQNITALFWDNASSTSQFLLRIKEEAAKKGRALTIETLYPCETLSKDKIDEGENYLSLMRANLQALLRSFA